MAAIPRMLGRALLVTPFFAGCGGSQPAANSAPSASDDDVSAHAVEQPSKPGSDSTQDADRESGGLKSATGGPAPEGLTGDATHAVLQLVIDDPELDPYLKLGDPGRFPLKLSGSAVPQGIELVKSTQAVRVVAAPSSKKDPVLVITDLELKSDSATVSYRYDVEGIVGTAHLKKGPHGWELTRSRIVEHYSK